METSVILPVEAEGFVQSLETFSLKEVGSARWRYDEPANLTEVAS